MSDVIPLISRLEHYSEKFPQEVLLVFAEVDGETDQVIVFRGFSSSLSRPTAYDPEVPTLPPDAVIHSVDRLKGPYKPQSPEYIERDIAIASFLEKLSALGL
jgi:hypothetical protein